jgi:hypothetical protein
MNPTALRVSLAVGSLVCSSMVACGSGTVPIGADPKDSGAKAADVARADATDATDAAHLPDGTPVEAAAPTPERILFVVETGATAIVDAAKARVAAVNKVIEKHTGQTNVEFGVIAFDQAVVKAALTFTAIPDLPNVDDALAQSGTDADYEGALSAAATFIGKDAMATAPATRSLVRYVVVFMGGAPPEPVCSVGSTTCGSSTCEPGNYCSAGACGPDPMICTVPRSSWGTAFDPPVPSSLYPDLVMGKDFNTLAAIQGKVESITALQASDHIGSVELDTVLVWSPSDAGAAVVPGVGRREDAVALLTQMATVGGGSYIDLSATPTLPF